MPGYRCYFLGRDNQIKARNDLELSSISEAIDKAVALLKAHPGHHSVEIWHGAQRLCAMYSARPPLGSAAFSKLMPRSLSVYRRLASHVLSERGVAVVWQLHLDASEAHLAGFAGAAALLLQVADAAEDLVWWRTQVTEAAQTDDR